MVPIGTLTVNCMNSVSLLCSGLNVNAEFWSCTVPAEDGGSNNPSLVAFRAYGIEPSGNRVQRFGYTRQTPRLVVFSIPVFETKTVIVKDCASLTFVGEADMLTTNGLPGAAVELAIGRARSGRATTSKIAISLGCAFTWYMRRPARWYACVPYPFQVMGRTT